MAQTMLSPIVIYHCQSSVDKPAVVVQYHCQSSVDKPTVAVHHHCQSSVDLLLYITITCKVFFLKYIYSWLQIYTYIVYTTSINLWGAHHHIGRSKSESSELILNTLCQMTIFDHTILGLKTGEFSIEVGSIHCGRYSWFERRGYFLGS